MRKMFSLVLFLTASVPSSWADDLAITTTSALYNGAVGVPYLFLQFQATGGTAGPSYSWDTADALPDGLTLDRSGILSGTPTTTGAYAFSVRATDSDGNQATGTFTLNVYQSDNAYCNPGNALIAPNGAMDGPALLPQSCFFTDSSATPSPGNIVFLTEGQSLQSALNAAACGDVIELQAGASFIGDNVTFPAKNCDDGNWITVRTSTPDSLLPAEGTRMTPCWAGVDSLPGRPPYSCPPGGVPPTSLLPQILLTTNARLSIPGDHYRLIGLEITRTEGGGPVTLYVSTAGGSQVILDRLWVHGTATDESNHGINVNNAHHVALVDSYLDDFHCTAGTGTCTDAQTFSGANDSVDGVAGTFKIVGNFQEASGENILFGGGASVDVPGDIEVRRNYMFKPMIWNPSDPTFFGTAFIVKNHYEMKNGVRALVEGNVMENVWGGFTQVGAHVLLTPKNQAAGTQSVCPICAITDVTLRYNHLISGGQAFQIADGANDRGDFAYAGNSHSVHDNLVENLQYATCHACGNYYNQISTGANAPPTDILHDLTINHITMVVAASSEGSSSLNSGFLTVGGPIGPVMSNIVFENSVFAAGYYGPWSTGGTTNCAFGQNSPLAKFNACWSSYVFSGNVISGGAAIHQQIVWPDGNLFPSNQSAIGYVSFNDGFGGDYRLDPSSPYKGTANDGTDPGANIDLVNQYTSNVR